MLVTSNGDIYCNPNVLCVSRDGGRTFTELTQWNSSPWIFSLLEGSDKAIYALANTSIGGAAFPYQRPAILMRSSDGGTTWSTIFHLQGHDFAMRGRTIDIGMTGADIGGSFTRGGVAISRDMGTTWNLAGLATIDPLNDLYDLAFDRNGKLLIATYAGVFRQEGSDWQYLAGQNHSRIATTPQGNILAASFRSYLRSTDNGATWHQNDSFSVDFGGISRGIPEVSELLGRKSGEFLVSLTVYRNDLATNTLGRLYRIGLDGRVAMLDNGKNFVKILEVPSSILYGSTVNFVDSLKSIDGGTTWVEGESPNVQAINSTGKGVQYGSDNKLVFGPLFGEKTSITLEGYTSQFNTATHFEFSPDDRLYIMDGEGIFYSRTPLR